MLGYAIFLSLIAVIMAMVALSNKCMLSSYKLRQPVLLYTISRLPVTMRDEPSLYNFDFYIELALNIKIMIVEQLKEK